MEWCKYHDCPCTQELCDECIAHMMTEEPDAISSQGECQYWEDKTLTADRLRDELIDKWTNEV